MDRQEFTKMLADYRKHAKMPIKDICFKLKCLPPNIYRLENATNNYNLQKCFDYLNAIGACVVVKAVDNQSTVIRDYPTLLHFVVNERLVLGYTQRSLSSAIKCNHTAIACVETQKNIMTIDTLLKIAEVLNFTISIIPMPSTSNEL